MPGHPHLAAEPGTWSPIVVVVVVLALAYLAAAVRVGSGPHGWNRSRTAAWLLGCAVAAVALSPVLAGHDPQAHMARHLLLGMIAPLGLVLAAPVTLLLRVIDPAIGRIDLAELALAAALFATWYRHRSTGSGARPNR